MLVTRRGAAVAVALALATHTMMVVPILMLAEGATVTCRVASTASLARLTTTVPAVLNTTHVHTDIVLTILHTKHIHSDT